jgi:hypothetical protein
MVPDHLHASWVMMADPGALGVDRTAFYSALIGGQFFHAFVCKTRFASVFRHGIFNNSMMLYG